MSRLPALDPARYTPEQKRLGDDIARARSGTVRGPFGVWLRVPRIADAANRLGNALRAEGRLEKRLFELMVLVVVRHWSARYAWWVHAKAGLEAGLAPETIEAVRTGRRPDGARADELVVHDTVRELIVERKLSQPAYDKALQLLGEELLIELVAATGMYSMVSLTLDAFDVDTPDGSRPLA